MTVLYSGSLNGTNIHTTAAINELKSNPDLRVLDNTEAFNFLDCLPDRKSNGHIRNIELNQKLLDMFGDDPNDYGLRANQFLFGEQKVIGGVKQSVPNGAFDIVSTNFAKGAKGQTIALVGFANEGQIFGASEMPTILYASESTHINGIPTETLRNVAKAEGMSPAFGIVKTQAQIDTARMSYTTNAEGKITGLDTNDVLSKGYGVQDTHLNPSAMKDKIHSLGKDLEALKQTNPDKFSPMRPLKERLATSASQNLSIVFEAKIIMKNDVAYVEFSAPSMEKMGMDKQAFPIKNLKTSVTEALKEGLSLYLENQVLSEKIGQNLAKSMRLGLN